jgi:hypothetical protein
MKSWLLAALACILAGCAKDGAGEGSAQRPSAGEKQPATPHLLRPATQPGIGPVDASNSSYLTMTPHNGDIVVMMDVYELVLPFGKISRNDDFWRRVDEDNVDVAMRDLMLKNGIRFGVAPTDEWGYLKSLIDQYCPTARKISTPPAASNVVELPMRDRIDQQDLFYLDRRGDLIGRTYHRCDDLFNIAYEAIPHRPGDTRIKVCGIVRGIQKQIQVTVLNQVREIEMKQPEQLYDMRLEAVVPWHHFLIIAPSEAAELPYNLGSTFLVRPGAAERLEMVLVLVPHPAQLENQVSIMPTEPGQAPQQQGTTR